MKLSIDYKAIFKDRVVIITGVGRSGTSILGKLLGSMQPSHFLYEPAILKLMPGDREALRAILFEDYFLPLMQGRNTNFNALEDSYIGNYIASPPNELTKEIHSRWIQFSHRSNAIKHLQEQGTFIIKMTEFVLWQIAKDTFPGATVISIIRNGNDVINSSIAHGWFQDDYQPIDWITGLGAPWFVAEDGQKEWAAWNPYTCAAAVWRSCIENNRIDNIDQGLKLRYEYLLDNPDDYIDAFQARFELTKTELTDKHIEDIKAFESKDYPSILGEIQEPERSRYVALMEELGYKP